MFALHSLYQEEISSRIKGDIEEGSFPHAVLIHGPRFSGRMSLVLETCRILSCGKSGDDQCDCGSCRAFSTLETQNVVIISLRDHQSVVEAAMSNLLEQRNSMSRDFLIRSVRVMLLQYHGALMEENTRKAVAAFDAAASVNEMLMDLEKCNDDTPKAQLSREIKGLRDALKPLYALAKKNTALTISQVRAIQEWTSRTSLDKLPRFVIIEGVEESTGGAKNSLLKFLEDPPANTYVFLISENMGRIIPTILSRVRRYFVPSLTEKAKSALINRVFYADGDAFDSLETYFLTRAGVDCTMIASLSAHYFKGAAGSQPLDVLDLHKMLNQLDESGQHEYFFRDLMGVVEQEFLDGSLDHRRARRCLLLIRETANRGLLYNQNQKLILESLFYQLQESI